MAEVNDADPSTKILNIGKWSIIGVSAINRNNEHIFDVYQSETFS